MKLKILIAIIRIVLTGWLVYQVYIEAGIYTATSIFLIGVSVELHSISIKTHLYCINKIKEHIFN